MQGVHYTEKARAQAGRIKSLPGLTSSTALHQLDQLNEDHGDLHYAFLSPIFDSISKAGYHAAFADHEQLRAAVAASPLTLYALGGRPLIFTSSEWGNAMFTDYTAIPCCDSLQ